MFDSLRDRMGGGDKISPMGIAHNSLFTARETIDLLNQLKADVTAAGKEGRELGFDAEEIDSALAEVHQGVQDGVGSETVLKGDF
ncbi:MAG: hypothetical protein JWQ22_1091 [Devosia sp.]|nr:hypothetical protein [Devosia sp.]